MTIQRLSPRQQEVMRLCFQGKGIKATSSALGISEHTVKDHRRISLLKLGVKTTEQAAVIAAKAGFV